MNTFIKTFSHLHQMKTLAVTFQDLHPRWTKIKLNCNRQLVKSALNTKISRTKDFRQIWARLAMNNSHRIEITNKLSLTLKKKNGFSLARWTSTNNQISKMRLHLTATTLRRSKSLIKSENHLILSHSQHLNPKIMTLDKSNLRMKWARSSIR